MTHPTVTPLRTEVNPHYAGWLLVTIVCPHCEAEHTHGARAGEDIGHRTAHCYAGGYVIESEVQQ